MKLKKDYIFCFITGMTVFLFFLHTLGYPWRHFDEQIIYNETILPIPRSFSAIFEYLTLFGLNNYFEASNPFYSTISNLRSDPFNFFLILFVSYFFQKSAFFYHLLSLILHIFNTCLLFLILNTVFPSNSNKTRLALISLLTLFWALNPLNIESILFATNWPALLTYFICFLIFYLSIKKEASTGGLLQSTIIFVLFLVALFTCEHTITLPVVLFCYLFGNKTSLKTCIRKTLPLFFATMPFIIYFLFSPTKNNLISIHPNNLQLFCERIFWLSPQIFFHFIKLILFPLHLTIDQSALVKLSNTLFEPYSIFCFTFMFGLISFLIIAAVNLKQKLYFCFFILFIPFFLSLAPFLHIISPLYNLVSERYFYFPLFFLTIGLSHILFVLSNNASIKKIAGITTLTFLIVTSFSCKAYFRTMDWKDSASLFMSALKESKSDLIKGLRMEMLGGVLYSYYGDSKSKETGKRFIEEGLYILENSLRNLELEKIKYQNHLPRIIKFYGLDPRTIQAKTAYLLAFTKLGLGTSHEKAYELMKPHMEDFSIIDTQILDLYTGLLFSLQKIDDAETLLKHALEKKLSPIILLPLSEIYKNKYKDLSTAENLLKKSFKYFPYDSSTLLSLKNFYLQIRRPYEYAFYSYLYGLRTHSKESLEESLKVYQSLYNQKMIDRINTQLQYVEEKK